MVWSLYDDDDEDDDDDDDDGGAHRRVRQAARRPRDFDNDIAASAYSFSGATRTPRTNPAIDGKTCAKLHFPGAASCAYICLIKPYRAPLYLYIYI